MPTAVTDIIAHSLEDLDPRFPEPAAEAKADQG
jgi:hypothetical protein